MVIFRRSLWWCGLGVMLFAAGFFWPGSVSAESDSMVTIVGRSQAYETEKNRKPPETKTVVDGDVTVVGRRANYASESSRLVTVTLKLTIAQAEQLPQEKVIKALKKASYLQRVDFDAKNAAIVIMVDTAKIPAEEAGDRARDILNREFSVEVVEIRVRRS